MKPVVFNPVAVDDLEEIINYIAADNPVAAEGVRQDLLDTAESLGHQPGLGIRPQFSAPRFAGIRFLPSSQYPTYLLFIGNFPRKSKCCESSMAQGTSRPCSSNVLPS